MGEQPCMWSTLDLHFLVFIGAGRTVGMLQKVLTMRRLQALGQLTLTFMLEVSWQDCIHFLQSIPPSVRKLSLRCLSLATPLPPIHVLAEELVKFEEVHLCDFGGIDSNLKAAILRAVAAVVGSSGKESKLKVLSMFARAWCISDALTEARKVLTVNIITNPKGC